MGLTAKCGIYLDGILQTELVVLNKQNYQVPVVSLIPGEHSIQIIGNWSGQAQLNVRDTLTGSVNCYRLDKPTGEYAIQQTFQGDNVEVQIACGLIESGAPIFPSELHPHNEMPMLEPDVEEPDFMKELASI